MLVFLNKNFSRPYIERLLNETIYKQEPKNELNDVVYNTKAITKYSMSPIMEIFAPITIYIFFLHLPRMTNYANLGLTLKSLLQTITSKYIHNYSSYFVYQHLIALAEYFQIIPKFAEYVLFEHYTLFIDACLDVIGISEEPLVNNAKLCKNIEILLAPSLDSLTNSLSPQLISVFTKY